jgi:hypothetical protein
MNNIIEYQTGAHAAGDFEVMLESTANLYAAVSIVARCNNIDNDAYIMAHGVDVENELINEARAEAYAAGEGSRPFEFC